MSQTISAEAVYKMIEDLKCKSYIEGQYADALESQANEERQKSEALSACVEQLEALLKGEGEKAA